MRNVIMAAVTALALAPVTSCAADEPATRPAVPPDKAAWLAALGQPEGFPPHPAERYARDTARAPAEGAAVLRFEEPATAVINYRVWDKAYPGQAHFDAYSRFMLVRFPGAAEAETEMHAGVEDVAQ